MKLLFIITLAILLAKILPGLMVGFLAFLASIT